MKALALHNLVQLPYRWQKLGLADPHLHPRRHGRVGVHGHDAGDGRRPLVPPREVAHDGPDARGRGLNVKVNAEVPHGFQYHVRESVLTTITTIVLLQGAAAAVPTVEDAMRLAAQGDFAAAERHLAAFIARNPRDADAQYRLGVVRMRQNKLPEAAAALTAAIRLDAAPPAFHLALAETYLRQPDRARAIAAAAEAALRAGDNAALWRAIAALQARAADGLGEARSLQESLRLKPDDRAAHVRLATLLLDHRTADGAVAVATAALVRFPNDAELWRLRGLGEYAMGNKADAVRSFLAAIDAAPADAIGYASLETLLPDAEAVTPATLPEIVRRLRPFAARNPVGHYLLALAVPADAETHLREAAGGAPDFWPAHYQLGRLLQERGERDAAVAEFQAVLRLNRSHAESHYALSQLIPARDQARLHREEHHRLRQEAAQAEQARAAAKPRIQVALSPP